MPPGWPRLPMFDKMADAMTQVAGEIKDGKYASVQEARQALYQKMAAAFGAGGYPPGGRRGKEDRSNSVISQLNRRLGFRGGD